MSIAWGTVQTAAATALLVTLVVEYAVKPQLEARKDRHLEHMRTRRRFFEMLTNLALSSGAFLEDFSAADGDSIVRSKIQAERQRQYDRMQALVTELFDTVGYYASVYPGGVGWQRGVMDLGTTMHGVMLSARSRREQARIIAELTGLAGRVYFQGVRKAVDVATAQKQLRTRIREIQQAPVK